MLLADICDFAENLHALTAEKGTLLRRPIDWLPLDGLYFFFEAGQKITIKSREYDRVVRIGINEKPNNFRKRIRGHYRGNIEGSVFRENIGWALLDADGKKPLENYRTKKSYKKQNSGGPIEKQICDYFSKDLTYKAFKLDYGKLASYEEILIAAFSIFYQHKLLKKEVDFGDWLGLRSYSIKNRIKRSGLWNSDGVIFLNDFLLSEAIQVEGKDVTNSVLKDLADDLSHNIL